MVGKKIAVFLCTGILFTCFMAANVNAEGMEDAGYAMEDAGNHTDTSNDLTDVLPSETMVEEANSANPTDSLNIGVQLEEKVTYKKSELRLMSCIIYCEARGESYAGKKAVGIVVMNRLRSRSYPNTLKGVIYQRRQFGPVRNGHLKKALAKWDAGKFRGKAARECIRAAEEALSGDTTIQVKNGKAKDFSGYKFFSGRLPRAKYRIGNHLFK